MCDVGHPFVQQDRRIGRQRHLLRRLIDREPAVACRAVKLDGVGRGSLHLIRIGRRHGDLALVVGIHGERERRCELLVEQRLESLHLARTQRQLGLRCGLFHGHRAALGIGDLEREAVAVVARSDRHIELRSRLRLGARTHFALQHHAFAALLVRNDVRIDLLGRGIGYVVVLGQVEVVQGHLTRHVAHGRGELHLFDHHALLGHIERNAEDACHGLEHHLRIVLKPAADQRQGALGDGTLGVGLLLGYGHRNARTLGCTHRSALVHGDIIILSIDGFGGVGARKNTGLFDCLAVLLDSAGFVDGPIRRKDIDAVLVVPLQIGALDVDTGGVGKLCFNYIFPIFGGGGNFTVANRLFGAVAGRGSQGQTGASQEMERFLHDIHCFRRCSYQVQTPSPSSRPWISFASIETAKPCSAFTQHTDISGAA